MKKGVMRRTSNHTILIGKQEGEKHVRSPRHRWELNIKVDPKEIGCKGVD
jgi:hypothetical protein